MIRLENKNCEDALAEIPDGSVDCVLTDPPYLYLKNQKLDRPFDEKLVFSEMFRVLKKGGFIVMFGRGTSFYRWNTMLADMGMVFKEEIIWDKRRHSSPITKVARVHELATIASKGKGVLYSVKVNYGELKKHDLDSICGDLTRLGRFVRGKTTIDEVMGHLQTATPLQTHQNQTVSLSGGAAKIKVEHSLLKQIFFGMREKSICCIERDHYTSIHPTQKPVRLLERLMALVTKEGDTVLDPFAGSGSTAIACINQNRDYIGFEIDEEFYTGAKNRIDEHMAQIDK